MDVDNALARIRNGDNDAFGVIYDTYQRMVMSVLRKVGRCPRSEMDEHLNAVFFEVYKGVFHFRGQSQFSTYVYQIALHYCYKLSKKIARERSRKADLDEDLSDSRSADPDDAILAEKLLDSLNENLRTVTVLYYYENMPLKEIGDTLGISENAVKNRLFQARQKMRDSLDGPAKKKREDTHG